MDALQVQNLGKSYGTVAALRGVSFAVAPGEVFGYLGPNGAGKTTTLRCVLGLVRPDAGEVHLLDGRSGEASVRAAVGYLPGELSLYGAMRGRAVLDWFAAFRPKRPPVLRERLLAAFALPGDVLDRRVKTLSHGTKQKLGLVIAMQHDPELLILDEPTAGLDPLVQQAFRDEVRGFAARGRAVLFSSHVLSEVEAVCHRVAILRAGELVTCGTMDELRGLMVRRLTVRFRGPAPAGLADVPGVARAEVSGAEAELWVEGDVNAVLRRLAACELERFVFPEPQLEDIFRRYYAGEEAGRG